jgi:hypothetical protein
MWGSSRKTHSGKNIFISFLKSRKSTHGIIVGCDDVQATPIETLASELIPTYLR